MIWLIRADTDSAEAVSGVNEPANQADIKLVAAGFTQSVTLAKRFMDWRITLVMNSDGSRRKAETVVAGLHVVIGTLAMSRCCIHATPGATSILHCAGKTLI